MKQANENKRNRLTDIENNWWLPVGKAEEEGEKQHRRLRVKITICKINKLQGYIYILQHREYSQYFMITLNG